MVPLLHNQTALLWRHLVALECALQKPQQVCLVLLKAKQCVSLRQELWPEPRQVVEPRAVEYARSSLVVSEKCAKIQNQTKFKIRQFHRVKTKENALRHIFKMVSCGIRGNEREKEKTIERVDIGNHSLIRR